MRYYDLETYLRTVSRVTGRRAGSFPAWVVDLDAAVAALKEGGGLSEHDQDDQDAAAKAARLLTALVRLCPVHLGVNNNIALRATKEYLAIRGYRLAFRNGAAGGVLLNQIEDERLSLDDLRRALLNSMSASGPAVRVERPLDARVVCLAPAGHRAGRELVATSATLRNRLSRYLKGMGAQVLLSPPRESMDAGTPGHARSQQETDDLFTRRMTRLTTSDALIVLDDQRGRDCAIDSDCAKRLAMPLFTLRMHDAARPYPIDGWNVVIDVDLASPHEAVQRAMAELRRYSPMINDFAAYRRAVEYKNKESLEYLRGSWQALSPAQREVAVKLAQLPAARIDTYLRNGLAMELASGRERRGLELALLSPPRQAPGFHVFHPDELALLSRAGGDLGLDNETLLNAVAAVTVLMSEPYARRRLRLPSEARAALAEVLDMKASEDP